MNAKHRIGYGALASKNRSGVRRGLRPRRKWREASPLPHTMPIAPPGIRAAESCDGTDFQREQQQRPNVGRSARCQRASSEIPVRLPLISVEFVLWRRLLAILEMSKRAFCKANASNGRAARTSGLLWPNRNPWVKGRGTWFGYREPRCRRAVVFGVGFVAHRVNPNAASSSFVPSSVSDVVIIASGAHALLWQAHANLSSGGDMHVIFIEQFVSFT